MSEKSKFAKLPPVSSDFSEYLKHERAKSIPIQPYDLFTSLRIWLKKFEQHAVVHGITDFNLCATHLSLYLPDLIQQWIPTLDASVLNDWELLKESLLLRFGNSLEDDNRALLQQLKNCKKRPQESIRLHATKWETLLGLLTENYTEQTKITFFIQSLDKRDMKLTLSALVASLHLETVHQVIQEAIKLENQAKLLEEPEIVSDDREIQPTPMDIDYLKHQRRYKPKKQFTPKSFHGPTQLRAYDKQGNPICDYCHAKHRTVECQQHQQQYQSNQPNNYYNQQQLSNSYHQRDSRHKKREMQNLAVSDESDDESHSDIVSSCSLDISNLTQHVTSLPKSTINILGESVKILWDSGSAITAFNKNFSDKLQLLIDSSKTIIYRDVNSNLKSTCGVTTCPVFGQSVKVHVIDGLSCPVIFGWDFLKQFKGKIDSEKDSVLLKVNGKTLVIPTSKPLVNVHHSATLENARQSFTNDILQNFQSIITKDNEFPSVTTLMEFTIDTGDHEPHIFKTSYISSG